MIKAIIYQLLSTLPLNQEMINLEITEETIEEIDDKKYFIK